MEKVLEQIQNARKELINSYFETEKEYDETDKLINSKFAEWKAGKGKDTEIADAFNKKQELGTKCRSLRSAINCLGNAMYHLGCEVDTFWGK